MTDGVHILFHFDITRILATLTKISRHVVIFVWVNFFLCTTWGSVWEWRYGPTLYWAEAEGGGRWWPGWFTPGERAHCDPLNRGLGEPLYPCGRLGEKKNLLPLLLYCLYLASFIVFMATNQCTIVYENRISLYRAFHNALRKPKDLP